MGKHSERSLQPWLRVARTLAAVIPAAVVAIPLIVQALGIDPARWPRVAAALSVLVAVCAAITRVLAVPAVNEMLGRLRAAPAEPEVNADDAG